MCNRKTYKGRIICRCCASVGTTNISQELAVQHLANLWTKCWCLFVHYYVLFSQWNHVLSFRRVQNAENILFVNFRKRSATFYWLLCNPVFKRDSRLSRWSIAPCSGHLWDEYWRTVSECFTVSLNRQRRPNSLTYCHQCSQPYRGLHSILFLYYSSPWHDHAQTATALSRQRW